MKPLQSVITQVDLSGLGLCILALHLALEFYTFSDGIWVLYIASCSDLSGISWSHYFGVVNFFGMVFCDLVQYPWDCFYISRLFGPIFGVIVIFTIN